MISFVGVVAFVGMHVFASLLLGAFGYHRWAMARAFRRLPRRTPPAPAQGTNLPFVTVQIPLYNERYVAERAIRAVARLTYPSARLQIQVLDDSTDETSATVARVVSELQATGINVMHLKRNNRTGYKAGALAAGLKRASGELVAIFDADFVPHADFLLKTVPEFDDEQVGMVQARWGHLNADASILTRAQALQLDAHFTTEHGVRAALGYFFNFNGTAGVWRRAAVDDAGGWHADTLTEDLDLSYRAQLRGWRFVYRDDVEVPAELPVEVAAYRNQQQRWAHGGVQTARKILPRVFEAQLPGAVKRAALWHLLIHFAYPLLVVVALAGLGVGLLTHSLALRWVLAVDGVLLTFAMVSLTYFYGATAKARDRNGWRLRIWLVPAIMLLGAGISIGQTLAIVRGLRGTPTPFRRTPKYDLAARADGSWLHGAYRLPTTRSAFLECSLGALVLAATMVEALRNGVVPSGLALLFGLGLVAVSAAAFAQATHRGLKRRR